MLKAFHFIKYFFYIAFNWNVKIAIHIIRKEIKGERKYGINTTGADELKTLEKRGINIDNATIYMPVSYDILEFIFNHGTNVANIDQEFSNSTKTNPTFNITTSKHFLDIGCGKGRALCVAGFNGIKKITGIDFSKELCISAENNCAQLRNKIPDLEYRIVHNDAFYFEIPDDVDCIFMFNPFDEVIMSGVAQNIIESFENNPRKITLIYVNPVCIDELYSIGFKLVYHFKKMKYLEAIIAELNP